MPMLRLSPLNAPITGPRMSASAFETLRISTPSRSWILLLENFVKQCPQVLTPFRSPRGITGSARPKTAMHRRIFVTNLYLGDRRWVDDLSLDDPGCRHLFRLYSQSFEQSAQDVAAHDRHRRENSTERDVLLALIDGCQGSAEYFAPCGWRRETN